MNQPCTRSAVKFDLFADQARQRKIEALGDPLQVIAKHIDFDHLVGVIDGLCPRADTRKGGRPPYPSAARSEMLKALGYREHIQRKAPRGKPLSECQKKRNTRIARTRARVEHPFAQIQHMDGKLIRTIGQARATVAMTMMATCYNIKRLARFLKDGMDAFYKTVTSPSKSEIRLKTAKA